MADIELNQPIPVSPSVQRNLLTADDLAKQPDDGTRYELVKGVLQKMPPAGFEHGICAAEIGSKLNVHVKGFQCRVQDIFA